MQHAFLAIVSYEVLCMTLCACAKMWDRSHGGYATLYACQNLVQPDNAWGRRTTLCACHSLVQPNCMGRICNTKLSVNVLCNQTAHGEDMQRFAPVKVFSDQIARGGYATL